MTTSSTPSAQWLLVVLLLNLVSIAYGIRENEDRRLRNVYCPAVLSSFYSYVFMDVSVVSNPEIDELYQLEGAFKFMYNEYIKENYCDTLFREVFDVDVQFHEQLDEYTQRYILSIQTKCRGACDDSTDLFSTNNRRDLGHAYRHLGKGDKKKKKCFCPDNAGAGTPSIAEFTPALSEYINILIQYDHLPSVASLTQIVEVVPVPCGDETEFESAALVSFGSKQPEFADGDIAVLPQGFLTVYNDLQSGACDRKFRRLASVEASVVDTRRLDDLNTGGRDLQFNTNPYRLVLNMAARGKCKGCPRNSSMFKNDAVKRELLERRQNGLCFCSAESSGDDTVPTTEEFRAGYSEWIVEQSELGNIKQILSAQGVVQVDENMPSAAPSTQPSAKPSVGPSPLPSDSPSEKPSASPSASPSSLPSAAPSSSPSRAPTSMPSRVPSSIPSSNPSDKPSTVPLANPSSIPTFTPSSTPTKIPPTTTTTTGLPSASPSFSTLCTPSELDTLLVYQTFQDGDVSGWENAKLNNSEPSFTTFLGQYQAGDGFPVYTASFDTESLNQMYFSFDFYEIDSWDSDVAGGPDTLSMRIEGENNLFDVIQFGTFEGDASDQSKSGNSTKGLIQWSIESKPIEQSPQGFGAALDQKHYVVLRVPLVFYELMGSVKLIIAWSLKGEKDEAIGIDNFKMTACVDAAPSIVRSLSPSTFPSIFPSMTGAPTL